MMSAGGAEVLGACLHPAAQQARSPEEPPHPSETCTTPRTPVWVEVPEAVCEAQLCVSQQLVEPLPVRAPHKVSNGARLAAVHGLWRNV